MLDSILEEIKKLRERVSAAIPTQNNMAQNNMARRNSAKLRLPDLERDYRTALTNRIVPILVTGSEASQFAIIAKEETGTVVVDGEAVYAELISRLPKEAMTMATKNVSELISRHFSDIATDSGILSYPAINHRSSKGFSINSGADLERFVKRTINDNVGVEMSALFNLKSIANQALELNFSSSLLPVLVVVEDESLLASLVAGYSKLSGLSFFLTAGEISDTLNTDDAVAKIKETNKENVIKALTKIKNKIKKEK